MILIPKKLFLIDNKHLLSGLQQFIQLHWRRTLQQGIFTQLYMAAFLFIAFLTALLYCALLIYYRFAWKKIRNYESQVTDRSTFISVIIPARNESRNIKACLDSLIAQSYPSHLFEVIVVDDHSEDNTAVIIETYADKNVRLISLKDHVIDRVNSYKKKAIEVAVAQAKGILIITTDADCTAKKDWLQTIAAVYEERKPAFIAAPVSIECKFRFTEIFQALDFMTLQGITGAVVSKKQMTMCNGANMAYERAAFYEVNGFAGIDTIASGDDMLLMHKIYKRYPERVLFLKSRSVIVQTAAAHTIREFFNQRIRWASKADKYDDKRILPVLVVVYLFNCLMLVLPVVALFNNGTVIVHAFTDHLTVMVSPFETWVALLALKIIAELLLLFPVAKFFGKRNLLWLFPLMQPFHILYTVIAGWLGKFGKYSWKGRTVN